MGRVKTRRRKDEQIALESRWVRSVMSATLHGNAHALMMVRDAMLRVGGRTRAVVSRALFAEAARDEDATFESESTILIRCLALLISEVGPEATCCSLVGESSQTGDDQLGLPLHARIPQEPTAGLGAEP